MRFCKNREEMALTVLKVRSCGRDEVGSVVCSVEGVKKPADEAVGIGTIST